VGVGACRKHRHLGNIRAPDGGHKRILFEGYRTGWFCRPDRQGRLGWKVQDSTRLVEARGGAGPQGMGGARAWPNFCRMSDQPCNRISPLVAALLSLASLLGAGLVLWLTRHGIAINYDSVHFLDSACSLAEGKGYLTNVHIRGDVMTHWPPFYSFLLSLPIRLGISPEAAARWLSALCFGGTVFVCGYGLARFFPAWPALGLAAALMTAVAADLLNVHAYSFSEHPFIFLSVLGCFWLAQHLHTRSHAAYWGAALALGLAWLTRYFGLPWILAGSLALLWLGSGEWKKRLIRAGVFGVAAGLPMMLFLLRNRLAAQQAHDMSATFEPIPLSYFRGALSLAANWLWPWVGEGRTGLVFQGLLLVVAVTLAALGLWALRRQAPPLPEAGQALFIKVVGLFLAAYFVFYLFALAFLSLNMYFEPRYFVAPHVLAILFLLALAPLAWRQFPRGGVLCLAVAVLAGAAVLANVVMAVKIEARLAPGLPGSIRLTPATREMVAWVDQSNDASLLFSNDPPQVFYLTGRSTRQLPEVFNIHKLKYNQDFDAKLRDLGAELRQKDGLIIYFKNRRKHPEDPEMDLLQRRLGLEIWRENQDLAVLRPAPAAGRHLLPAARRVIP